MAIESVRWVKVATRAEYDALVASKAEETTKFRDSYFYYIEDTNEVFKGESPLTDYVILTDDVTVVPADPIEKRFYCDVKGGLAVLVDNRWIVLANPAKKPVMSVTDASVEPSGAEEGYLYFDGTHLGTLVGDDYVDLTDIQANIITMIDDVTVAPGRPEAGALYADKAGGLATAYLGDNGNMIYMLLIDPTYKSLEQIGTVAVAPEEVRYGTMYCDNNGYLAYKSRVPNEEGYYEWIQVKTAESLHAKEADTADVANQIANLLVVARNTKYDKGNVRLCTELASGQYLICAQSGVSSVYKPEGLNKKAKVGTIVEDGTVLWKICQFANTEDIATSVDKVASAEEADNALALGGKPATDYALLADVAPVIKQYNSETGRMKDADKLGGIPASLYSTKDEYAQWVDQYQRLDDELTELKEQFEQDNTEDDAKFATKEELNGYLSQATKAYKNLTAKDTELETAIGTKVDQTAYDAAIKQAAASYSELAQNDVELGARIDKVVEDTGKSISELQEKDAALQTAVDAKVEQSAYNEKVAALEAKDEELAASITSDEEALAALQEKDAELEASIGTKVDQTAYDAKVGELQTAIDAKVEQSQYNTDVAALKAKDEELAKAIDDKINALVWKPAVDDQTALVAIVAPQEGWTVSLKDTNKVYRFDAEYAGDFDSTHIAAGDGTPGAWIELGHTIYSLATQTADGLMSATDKKTLDDVAITYETKTDATAKQQTLQSNIDTLEDTVDDLNSNVEQYQQTTTDSIDELRGTVDDLNTNVENYNKTHTQEIAELQTSVGDLNTNLEAYNNTMTSEFAEVRENISDVQTNLDNFINTIQGEDGSGGELAEIRQSITDVQGNLDSHISDADGKFVVKEDGKGLSTNDFSDEYKGKLDSLDTTIEAAKQEAITHANDLNSAMDTRMQAVEDKFNEDGKALKAVDADTLGGNAVDYFATAEALQEAVTDETALEKRVTTAEGNITTIKGYFNESGKAKDALLLEGHNAAYFATAEALQEAVTDETALEERVTTAEGEIDTLQGYFTEGKANEALNATTLGGNAVDYFATKSALDSQGKTVAANVSDIAELQGYFEGGAALNAKALDGHEASYFAIGSEVETIKGYFTDGKANTALALDGFDQNLYLLKTEAAGTYITPEAVDTKLADYAKTSEVSTQIAGAISGLQWKTSVVDVAALKAITTPKEGWTVSVDDTNAIYRYDAQCVEAGDGDKYVKADDATAGAWVKLSTSFYSVATSSTDGLMSSADKNKLDAFTNASDYLRVEDAATTYLGLHATADNAMALNGRAEEYFATALALNNEIGARTATDAKVTKLEGYFTGDAANKANELVGFNPADYSTTTDVEGKIAAATADMATNASVNGKLANYATTEAMTTALADKVDSKAMTTALDSKVDKVAGKQLSTEDFTTEFKTAVETLDTTYQPVGDYVTNETLIGKGYAVDAEVKTTYATKDEVSLKADTSALANYATTEAMTDAIAEATADMATNTEVSGTYQVKGDYATTSVVDEKIAAAITDMATNTSVNGKLANYATTEAMTTALADKVDVVAGKQLSTEDFTTEFKTAVETLDTTYQPVGNYVTDEALTGKGYAVASEVASTYATKDELSAKADGSALANYVQKDELDTAIGDMATKTEVAATYATNDDLDSTNVVLNTVDGTVVALQEQIALLKQQIQNLKTPDVETVTVEADVTQEDKDVKVVAAEVADTTRTVKAKSIQVEDYKATNSRTVLSAANDVTINNLTTSGDLPKSTSNAGMSIYSNADVVINGGDWNQTGYNAIEIGLNTDSAPKNVLIDGIDFDAKMSNNAILVFAHQANATITISNCHFADVSNCVRISNRLNVPAKIKFINCTCDAWESRPGYELYPGFLILEDYTSKNETDFKEQNRFAKLDIEFINCYGPYGKLEGDASTLSVPGPEQAVYICVDNWNSKVLTYDGNEQYFPKISAI